MGLFGTCEKVGVIRILRLLLCIKLSLNKFKFSHCVYKQLGRIHNSIQWHIKDIYKIGLVQTGMMYV
jgi:hypothetical protein